MEELELYIDRLKSGEYKEFCLTSGPEIMSAEDNEATFEKEIQINGSAALANDHLVLNISINTEMKNSCKICTDPISHNISIEQKNMPFSLKTMKNGKFCLKDYIRELIFLNIPRYSECKGSCPEREVIKKYLTKSDHPHEDNKE